MIPISIEVPQELKAQPTLEGDDDQKEEKTNTDHVEHQELETTVPNIWQELVVFGFALFLHSFIDGLTVGLFKELDQIGIIGGSIILHQIPISLTLGFLFQRSNLTLRHWPTRIIFFIFIFSSPLGVIVGSVISDQIYDFALMVIQAFSAGTFVYLGAVDLIVHEFFTPEVQHQPLKIKLIKILAVMLGWGFIICLSAFFDPHGGEEGH